MGFLGLVDLTCQRFVASNVCTAPPNISEEGTLRQTRLFRLQSTNKCFSSSKSQKRSSRRASPF